MRGLMVTGIGSRAALLLAGAALLMACGASPRMVHQSAYYFERCHAADLDDQRTVDERQACWAAWLRHWSSAQPAVRVRYAERRVAALSRGEEMAPLPHESPGEPAVADDAPPGSAQVLVEASTSGGPPQIEVAPGEADPQSEAEETEEAPDDETAAAIAEAAEDDRADGDPIDELRPGPPPPPVREPRPAPPPPAPVPDGTHPCTELCNPRWDICVRRCSGRGAPCVNACRSEYRICMGACR